MLPTIKQYKLKPDITKEDLLNAGFKEGGWQKEFNDPKVNYYIPLIDEISLHIEIETNTMQFDSIDNVLILDEDFGQPYGAFYRDIEFEYLNKAIDKYNIIMDGLIEKGILQYTIEEATKQYYNNEISLEELMKYINESDEGDKERRRIEKEFYEIFKDDFPEHLNIVIG
jgi:hypothetical protein